MTHCDSQELTVTLFEKLEVLDGREVRADGRLVGELDSDPISTGVRAKYSFDPSRTNLIVCFWSILSCRVHILLSRTLTGTSGQSS